MIINKTFFSGLAILLGTIIGAGVYGIPFVASKSGFIIALFYIVFLGLIMLFTNLCLGEIILRTKEKHQLSGYAKKYLGGIGKNFMDFAFIFGIYAALVAYALGIGESLSFLFFKNLGHSLLFGFLFSILMTGLLYRGLRFLKGYEKIGVSVILGLLVVIILLFASKISVENLSALNFNYLFLPFGVILFSFIGFSVIPEVNFVLKKDKKPFKKILIFGSLIPIVFYALFSLVVVGFKGSETPEIATLALGAIFIFLGIFTMSNAYLALGNALQDHFKYDSGFKKNKAWFLSAIIPIFIFLFIKMFKYFTFTKILSIGGVVSGGLIGILILLMAKKAKKRGERKPKFSVKINWFIILTLSLIFIFGIVREVIVALR